VYGSSTRRRAAFVSAAAAAFRWRSPDGDEAGTGAAEVAGVTVGAWLLSVRAADAPGLDDLRGSWAPQVAAAQVSDDAGASAYAVLHHDWTTRSRPSSPVGTTSAHRTATTRGGDDTCWLSLIAQPTGSRAEATAWCAANGLAEPTCSPRLVSD
jgi:hypothetical protein